jgi:hypothetical protein
MSVLAPTPTSMRANGVMSKHLLTPTVGIYHLPHYMFVARCKARHVDQFTNLLRFLLCRQRSRHVSSSSSTAIAEAGGGTM